MGALAQLGERLICIQEVTGSIPVGSTSLSGAVAQLGERCNRTAEVGGSIPLGSTKFRMKPEIYSTI